jgi:single-strand DNA-binding protein
MPASFISPLIIVGNLGRDPEMRFTPSGKPVTDFSVAVNRQFSSSNGEQVKETIWFKITTWGKQAEICTQYLKKGASVLIEGRLDYDGTTGGPQTWEGSDGKTHTGFGIVASQVRFNSPANNASADTGATEDDLPF